MSRRSIRGSLTALVLVLAIAATPPLAASAPSPEAVRKCVELNLPKYTNPGSAVVAQYSDIETACRAALDEGGVSVQFDPGVTAGGSSGGTRTRGGSGGGGSDAPAPASAAPASSAPASSSANPTSQRAPSATSTRRSSALVVERAIAEADAGAANPLPTSASGGSAVLLYLALGGAVLLAIGASAVAVRRRRN